ncbi:WhiB family transcriptional regulator [Actinoplanes sp. NPDC051470]|uniref:WhiB family transcriptional regulator n=1 Tax=Actinoplanes sp. NPDC051470 TaxID=3157224 RepID=UPI00342A88B3
MVPAGVRLLSVFLPLRVDLKRGVSLSVVAVRPSFPCESDPELWFSDEPGEQAEARTGCEACPLSRFHKCRAEGFNHEFGIFGGLTSAERETIRSVGADSAPVESDAQAIVRLYAEGVTQADLAAQFGRTKTAIKMVVFKAKRRANLAAVTAS